MYAGQVHIAKILYDPKGEIIRLKEMLEPYPPRLKTFLIREFLWQADFALDIAKKAVTRADVFYITGCFFECAACLIQVLFSLNETFWINEKGAVVGTNAKELRANLHQFKELVKETRELSQS